MVMAAHVTFTFKSHMCVLHYHSACVFCVAASLWGTKVHNHAILLPDNLQPVLPLSKEMSQSITTLCSTLALTAQ